MLRRRNWLRNIRFGVSADKSIQIDQDIKERLLSEFGITWPDDVRFKSEVSESNKQDFWVHLLIANADNTIKTPRNATPEEAAFVAEFIKKRNSPEDQYECALFLYNKKEYSEARKWSQRAVAQENVEAKVILGIMCRNGIGELNNAPNYAAAMEWFQRAEAEGDSDAKVALGYMYEKGLGCDQDIATARKWYQNAADQGNTVAQQNLARMNAT